MKVLIVDDMSIYRKILKNMLTNVEQCDTAAEGIQALEYFELAHAEKKPYDLILLDITMPEMNGKEFLEIIRKKEKKKKIAVQDQVKIIMITASADSGTITKCFDAGCDGYIVKPVKEDELQQKIEKVFQAKE